MVLSHHRIFPLKSEGNRLSGLSVCWFATFTTYDIVFTDAIKMAEESASQQGGNEVPGRLAGIPLSDFVLQLEDYTPTVS